MVVPAGEGIDLFNSAGRSIWGWIKSFKTGNPGPVRQPFCSQLEERLLLWLEYHPQVACYERSDIGPQFATTSRTEQAPPYAPSANERRFQAMLRSAWQKHSWHVITQCLIVDDAHDLSLEHLMFIKELTGQERWAMEKTIWQVVGGESK